jgi:hypothetical protein
MYHILFLESLSQPYHEKELYTERFAILDPCPALRQQGRCLAAYANMQHH